MRSFSYVRGGPRRRGAPRRREVMLRSEVLAFHPARDHVHAAADERAQDVLGKVGSHCHEARLQAEKDAQIIAEQAQAAAEPAERASAFAEIIDQVDGSALQYGGTEAAQYQCEILR